MADLGPDMKKFTVLSVVFGMMFVTGTANAQIGNPSRAEVSIVRTCVDTSEPKNIYVACFGTLRESCKRRIGDNTMATDANCISNEKRAWTQILHETIRTSLEFSDAGLVASVRRSQAASQVANVNAVLKSFEGGNGAGAYAELAESREIAKRVQFFYENLP